jgi:hypothetical protein
MKIFSLVFLAVALVFSSCGKIENSSSIDGSLYGNYTDTGSPNFLATKQAMSGSCYVCHGAWKTYSEQDFITSGLIVPGSASTSKLYFRNSLASSGSGPKNMPLSGYPPISTGDLAIMEQWINAL